jgi:hypothetical protein
MTTAKVHVPATVLCEGGTLVIDGGGQITRGWPSSDGSVTGYSIRGGA